MFCLLLMFFTLAVTSILSELEVTWLLHGEINSADGVVLTGSGGISRVIVATSSAVDVWFEALILKLFSPSRSLTFAIKVKVFTL